MTVRASEGGHGARAIPRGVWVLGFVSLLMDTSSEMIHALLPLYMVTVLGTSILTAGLWAWFGANAASCGAICR
jgi:hypothetical protein